MRSFMAVCDSVYVVEIYTRGIMLRCTLLNYVIINL